MGSDTTIGVPLSSSAEERDTDDTLVSVHFPRDGEWVEQRLSHDEAMEVTLPNGRTVAVIEVDEDD